MQRKLSGKPVYLSGRNKSDREFIFLHMSNHYRRIVNATKAIDNSPPSCFKGKRPCTSNPGIPKNKVNRHFESLLLTDRSLSTNSNKDSWGTDSFTCGSRYHARCVPDASPNMTSPKLGDIDLIERITYDTKHGPSSYSEKCWSKPKEHTEKRIVLKENKSEVKHSAGKRSLSNAGHSERTQKRKLNSQPKTANSRSYCKCTKICLCDESGCVNESASKKMTLNPKEHSVTSSRDSAYNGGISSVPESRSPTPDHRSKKDCCCCCCERMQRASVLFPKERSNTTTPRATTPRATTPRATTPRGRSSRSRSPRPRSSRARSTTPKSEVRPKSATGPRPVIDLQAASGLKSAMGPKCPKGLKTSIKTPNSCSDTSLPISRSKTPECDAYEKMQDDALYVAFVQDITTEVLERNLYTNKALKNVMKKHLQKNLKTLDKDRMLQELEHLRMQLGIPEDQSLFDSAAETVDSACDLIKLNYPIISDSEFSFPVEEIMPPENIKCPGIIISEEKIKSPEILMSQEKIKSPEKVKSPEIIKSPEKTKSPENIKPPEKTKTPEKPKPLERTKTFERARSPGKAKPKPAASKADTTTCIFIKPSVDPPRLKATREAPLCVQTKNAYRQQTCGPPISCYQPLTHSSGPAICFIPHSSDQATACFMPQSSDQTTTCLVPQSSGLATACFMPQSSDQTTTCLVPQSPRQPTACFMPQSSDQATACFMPQSTGQSQPCYLVQTSLHTPAYGAESSLQTPNFTPQPSVVMTPPFMPQRSGQTKSMDRTPSKQTTFSLQPPTVHPNSPTQPSSPIHTKPSSQGPPSSILVKSSTQTPSSILSKSPTQTPSPVLSKPSTQAAPSLHTKSSTLTATAVHTKSSTQTTTCVLMKPSMQSESSVQTASVLTAPSFLPPTIVQTKVFLKKTPSRRHTSAHPERVHVVESRGKVSLSAERFRNKSEKSISALENPKNSSETDNDISGIPRKKSPRERRREDSILKNSTTRSRDISSEDSDRPSEPKKRSYGKSRRQKFPKRYTTSSSDSELSGCYSRTLVKENRKVSISKDTYSGGSSTPTHVRKKSRSVSFWRNPEYRSYHGPKIKTRKAAVSHSEESFVVGRKKSPKCE